MQRRVVIRRGYGFFFGRTRTREGYYVRIEVWVLPRVYRFRMPFAVAYATSSARELNESFCMRFALWDSTVR
jgi:hypothetical protein